MEPVWVFLGAGIGAVARYGVQLIAGPWATLGINVVGSFLIGLAMGLPNVKEAFRLFALVGVLGGFTTFSAFSAEFWKFGEQNWGRAALYLVGSVGLSLLACRLGIWLTSRA